MDLRNGAIGRLPGRGVVMGVRPSVGRRWSPAAGIEMLRVVAPALVTMLLGLLFLGCGPATGGGGRVAEQSAVVAAAATPAPLPPSPTPTAAPSLPTAAPPPSPVANVTASSPSTTAPAALSASGDGTGRVATPAPAPGGMLERLRQQPVVLPSPQAGTGCQVAMPPGPVGPSSSDLRGGRPRAATLLGVVWSSAGYPGAVLVRGHRLDGEEPVLFAGDGALPQPPVTVVVEGLTRWLAPELYFPAAVAALPVSHREWPGQLYLPTPGCYGLAIEGETFRSVMVVEALPR